MFTHNVHSNNVQRYYLRRKKIVTIKDVLLLMLGFAAAVTLLRGSETPNLAPVPSADNDRNSQLYTNEDISNALRASVRVFCFIISTKWGTEDKARHVHATWAKRCSKHVFVTANKESYLPSLDFNLTETKASLFKKIENTLKYIYNNELDKYDFFIKVDYDTYVVMDNLRFMLLPHSPEDPLFFGCRFNLKEKLYMSGGAGYVLSREAVRRAVENGFGKLPQCAPSERPGEDIEIGTCMTALNVTAVDTRDSQKRHRMLPLSPEKTLVPRRVSNFVKQYMVHNYTHGENCCSDYVISFHYVESNMMYVLESLFYKIRRVSPLDLRQLGLDGSNGDLISALKAYSINQSVDSSIVK
uniref:N-acetylgalactosaminide beta-1,3-galactosyltransferase n=1 Tax=Panagrellus redivivus TaxID=6233 RepID=A0A7E4VKU1_PANRE